MDVFSAIDSGDLAAALAVIDTDPGAAGRPHESGPSPVLYALYQGQRDIGEALADRVNALDLAEAAALDRAERVAGLLDAGADVNGRTSDGFTPLQLAAFFGAPTTAELLIGRSADLDAVSDNPMRIQALHAATAGGHRRIARALIDAGADLDARQRHGWTPLLAAADHGDSEIVEALLAKGADPRIGNDDGITPQAAATAKGHHELAALLADAATTF